MVYNISMDFALGYLFSRFFFRMADFFHHWYVDGSRYFAHAFVSFLERLDGFFGVRINWKYLFQPLYRDYTIIGRVMGFFFRSARIILGLAAYLLAGAVFLAVYVVWLALPFVLLLMSLRSLEAVKQ